VSFRMEQIGDATLYLGDCRDILPMLGKVDAVVTDPPYGIGIAANPVRQKHVKRDWDNSPPDQSVFSLISSISADQIIWGGNYFGLPPSQGFLIWDKKQPQDFSLAMCEMAWFSRQQPAKIWRQSVISYNKQHPTQKPEPLMRWCLEFLPDAEIVCDPFMGSGTTGVACMQGGKKFIGIEIDQNYFEIACRRIDAETRQPSMFTHAPKPPVHQSSLFDEAADSLGSFNDAITEVSRRYKSGEPIPPTCKYFKPLGDTS